MPGNFLAILTRWLASHLVILTLLGFVIAGLQVFGIVDWKIQLPRTQQAQTETHQEGAAATPPEAKPAAQADRSAPTPAAPTDAAPAQPRPRAAPMPKLIGGTLPVDQAMQRKAIGPLGADGGGEGAFRPPEELPDTDQAASAADRDSLFQVARRAFWNGDFEAAEIAYLDLIAAYPADADAFGELGNLYQSMGNPRQARDAFYEAGLRLKAAGDTEKLNQVIDILDKEGDSRGRELGR